MTPEERQKREAAVLALAERWPKCFAVDAKRRRPLKIGIAEEIRAAGLDVDVSAALAYYAYNASYMKALVAGAIRIGLDGEAAGTVTADQEAFARRELAKRETKQPQSEPAVARRPILSLPSVRPKKNPNCRRSFNPQRDSRTSRVSTHQEKHYGTRRQRTRLIVGRY